MVIPQLFQGINEHIPLRKEPDYQQRLNNVLASDDFKFIFKNEPNLELKILEGHMEKTEIVFSPTKNVPYPAGSIGSLFSNSYVDEGVYDGTKYFQDYSLTLGPAGLIHKISGERRNISTINAPGKESEVLKELNALGNNLITLSRMRRRYTLNRSIDSNLKTISYWSLLSERQICDAIENAVFRKLKGKDEQPRKINFRFLDDATAYQNTNRKLFRRGYGAL